MSKIQWTEQTWNPIVGCSILSPGCTNCYAMKMAARLEKMNRTGGSGSNYVNHYDGTTQPSKAGAVWTGKLARAPESVLLAPLGRKKPTMYFVNSMSDLFHESIPDEWIDRVFAVMTLCPKHTFQVLTKRAARMLEYLSRRNTVMRIYNIACDLATDGDAGNVILIAPGMDPKMAPPGPRIFLDTWPLPNVWLGVSCERQKEADERVPLLLDTPAAVRFISAEPLLGRIDFQRMCGVGFDALHGVNERKSKINWIIVGGESGPGARRMEPDWALSIVAQCQMAGVPCFVKQVGSRMASDIESKDRKGGNPDDWPSDLRVREFPIAAA